MLWLGLLGWLFAWAWMWPFATVDGLSFLGLTHHQPAPWLQSICLVAALVTLLRATTTRSAFYLAWWFATNWLLATNWWLTYSMTVYGGLPPVLAGLAVLALSAALGLYMGVCMGVLANGGVWSRSRAAPVWRALAVMAAWVLAEWLRAKWLTGFPWGEVGYAHLATWGWLAPVVGSVGVGAAAVFICAWLAASIHQWTTAPRTHLMSMGPPLAGFALLLFGIPSDSRIDPARWTQAAGVNQVALLQGNIGQAEKFGADALPAMTWYTQTIAELPSATADLVITPETAFPYTQNAIPANVWAGLQDASDAQDAALLLGLPTEKGRGKQVTFRNEAWALTPNESSDNAPGQLPASAYRYAKTHLVPFGELVPPGFQWFTDQLSIPLTSFERGGLTQPTFDWRGQRHAVTICYEDVFGDELAQRMLLSAQMPTAWINMSNLAWFGATTAVPAHLLMARWRALELGRPMLRATNTGATAVIGYRGDVQAVLPFQSRGILRAPYEGREGVTPYVAWAGQWGHRPVWILSLATLVLLQLVVRLWPLSGRDQRS